MEKPVLGTVIDNRPIINIEIISDTVCPWCFVGKRKMDSAITKNPNINFSLSWKPFLLAPNVPPEGYDLIEYLKKKYGEDFDEKEAGDSLEKTGLSVGIDFNENRRVVNTINSHRLIAFAKEKGKQAQIVEILYKMYFEQAKDISNFEVLTEAATQADINIDEIRTFLSGDKYRSDVLTDDQTNKMRRVFGVPYYTCTTPATNKKLSFSGAQSPEVFQNAFDRLLKIS